MAEGLTELKVETVRTSLVQSPLPSPNCWLKGSNIDLTVPNISPGHFFVYKNFANKTYAEVVGSMKKALSETLTSFYPLAGRFVEREKGEAEISCDNQGVPFLEARAHARVNDVDFSQPSLTVGGKLSPTRHPSKPESLLSLPVMAVQVTDMKCGGIVVGCCFDHRIVDGVSCSLFFKAWTEAAKGHPLSVTPCFQRSLMDPRRPLNITADIDSHYLAVPFSPLGNDSRPPSQIGRIYHLDSASLLKLQAQTNQNGGQKQGGKPKTKLEAVSAYIWRLVTRAQALRSSEATRISILVNGRPFLNIPECYFGNAIALPSTQASADEIVQKPLSFTADIVRKVVSGATNSEYFRSFVDWVEKKRPATMLARVYAEEGVALVVSGGGRIPIYEMDVGCGRPAFSSVYFPWGGTAAYVMVQASPLGEGNWVLYIHMAHKDLDAIESDPEFVLVRASQMNFWN